MSTKRVYVGYLARNEDSSLYFHKDKPHKRGTIWVNPKRSFLIIDNSYFPEVRKNDSEPTPVKVTFEIPYIKQYK